MSIRPTTGTRSTPSRQASLNRSTFQKALQKYIDGLPDKEQKKNFIYSCYDPNHPTTIEAVRDSIQKFEEKKLQKTSTLSKVIKKVMNALKDYNDIVNALASADPMPTAIIWGALCVVINAAHRHYELIDTIKSELRSLANVIELIRDYEKLWGDCPKLQEIFCDSYIHMFCFWNKVHEELTKPVYKAVASSASSNCLTKLRAIIKEMEDDTERMEVQFVILAEQKAAEEREKAEKERNAQSDYRQNSEDGEIKNIVCKWLRNQKVNAANLRRLEDFKDQKMDGTGVWLNDHTGFQAWLNRTHSSPVLRLHSVPGSGKSILCASAIRSVRESDPTRAVCYHFYRFSDEPFKARDVLRHFAWQLFSKYLDSKYSMNVVKDLKQKVQSELGPQECAEKIIATLVELLPGPVYFFLDGLDEESARDRWNEAMIVVKSLLELAKQLPNDVRIWSTSQNVDCVVKAFAAYPALYIKEEMEKDMVFYLTNEMKKLEICEEDRQSVLDKVDECAAGNFLWAKLMIKDLEKANCPADIKRIVKEGPTLDDYYKRYFVGLDAFDGSLARYIFALVAFARRPLRIRELREAVGMLRSRDAQLIVDRKKRPSLDPAEIPFVFRMMALFAPLIEVEAESDEDVQDDYVCRLYHSAVLKFLQRNPNILCSGPDKTGISPMAEPQISATAIEDACLLYLSQERYSRLLVSKPVGAHQWLDAQNKRVSEHHFLPYSAKYWDKHFDRFRPDAGKISDLELLETKDEEEFRAKFKGCSAQVKEFLDSQNFQTCIQAQSLFVDSQFESFMGLLGPTVKRVFPDWFIRINPSYKFDYHHFWYEWKHLLNCASNESEICPVREYAGEIDRCWMEALGSHNFLSKMTSRYKSFRFQTYGDSIPNPARKVAFEGLTGAGNELTSLQLISYECGRLQFKCEHWELSNSSPKLQRNQTLLFGAKSVNWMQYMQHERGAFGLTGFWRKNRALPVAFSQDCKDLRIGSQLYTRTDEGTYVAIPAFRNKDQLPYIEEFARRGHFVAVANRRSEIPESQLTYPSTEEPHADESDITKAEEVVSPSTASRQLARMLDEALKSIRNLSEAVAPPDPSELEETFKAILSAPPGTEGEEDIASAALEDAIKSLLDNPPVADDDDDDSGKPSLEKTLKSLIREAVRNGFDSSMKDESSDEASVISEAESSEASTETDNDAYESWSDCSSRASEEVESEDEMGRICRSSVDVSESEGSEVPEDGDAEDKSDKADEAEDSGAEDSDAEEPPVDPAAFGAGQREAYGGGDLSNEADFESDDGEQPELSFLKFLRSKRKRSKRSQLTPPPVREASLTIFNTRSPVPERVFHFTRKLPYMIYDSPPAIHPFETLAVWPVGGGSVLFADFEGNTFFIRELRPSKLYTRHIFMKCRFSECGVYLHIASLEGQHKPPQAQKRAKKQQTEQDLQMKLALRVATYRLCNNQPCRTPPSLVHSAGVELGAVKSLSVSKLPYTLTWRPEVVYLTCRSVTLQVHKIPLFGEGESGLPCTMRPKEIIVLPDTVTNRDVYYFPPAERTRSCMGRIIIGSDPSQHYSPPIGCFVHEGKDLGGWISPSQCADPEKQGAGQLIRPMEKFDPQEDCDLEPFLFLG